MASSLDTISRLEALAAKVAAKHNLSSQGPNNKEEIKVDTLSEPARTSVSSTQPLASGPSLLETTEEVIDDNVSASSASSFPDGNEDYNTLAFDSPAYLLAFYDEAINSGKALLHPWQVEELEKIGQVKPTAQDPYFFALCACNGSGKDRMFIAPTAVWLAVTNKRFKVVISSASDRQLRHQTEKYITDLATRMRDKSGLRITIVEHKITFHDSGSEILLFVTDDEGKAEGYHPIDTDSGMAIILNEAKNISEKIFEAFTRCTGYNYWLEISSPGEPRGHFYKAFNDWTHKRRISAYDCPHLGTAFIKEAARAYGVSSPLYRSMILAEFTSVGTQVVLTYEEVNRCIESCPPKNLKGPRYAGLDLSLGRDETCLSIWQGNTQIAQEFVTGTSDTVAIAKQLANLFRRHDLKGENIFADDGGIGHGISDNLMYEGYQVNRVHNQWPASNKIEYATLGAEMWFNFARMVQEGLLVILPDPKLIEQIATRIYLRPESTRGRIKLEGKKDMKGRGLKSPDRADAAILAFYGKSLEEVTELHLEARGKKQTPLSPSGNVRETTTNIQDWINKQKFAKYEIPGIDSSYLPEGSGPKQISYSGSLASIFESQ